MAEIIIYKPDAEKSFNGDVPDLKKEKDLFGIGNSFNDRIDKIFVKSGVWRLFVDIDFYGASQDYMYGSHHDNVFLRVGLEKVSTISVSCKASGKHADVSDGYPGLC